LGQALGKAPNTLGKGVVECNTWQSLLGKKSIGRSFFVKHLAAKVETKKNPKKYGVLYLGLAQSRGIFCG
jgi:hypothetical protein